MKKQFISHTKHKVMITCKRLTALMLTLLLFIMTIPSAIALGNDSPILPDSDIPETLTRAQLEAHGAVARLREEEPDEFTFVYLNEDGTRTSYSYGVAVKYEENGEYVDKDNTIKDFNNEYGNTASDVELRFPKHLNKISIKYKNHNIKIKPVTDIPAGHINASVNGNTVTYPNAFGQGMDLRYSSTMSGMKEDIILQSYQGVNTFSFEVETAGLELKQSGGQYVIADGDEVIFSFGDLEVTDSFTGENEATDNWDEHITYAQGSIQTVKENEKYIFTITVPEEFLAADTTVYPVYVDPSFNVTSNYIQDTYISEGHPDTNYGTSTSMRLGYNLAHQRNRILVQYSNFVGGVSRPGLTYSTINSAYYQMFCTSTYTSVAQADIYMISLGAQTWTESGATWNNASGSTSTNAALNGSTGIGNAGWYSFNITNAYITWWQAFMYKGVMIRMNNESSPNYRSFASANNADSTKLPYLTVNYGTDSHVLQFDGNYGYMEIDEVRYLSVLTNLSSSELNWSSSNSSVATVQSGGKVTARAAGHTTITVSSIYDTTLTDTYEIQVVAVPVDGITLNATEFYLQPSESFVLEAYILPANASVTDVCWESSNLSVARVDGEGRVTAVSNGTAIITATTAQGLKTSSCIVRVSNANTLNIKVMCDSSYQDTFGDSYQLVAADLMEKASYPFKHKWNIDFEITIFTYHDDSVNDCVVDGECLNCNGTPCEHSDDITECNCFYNYFYNANAQDITGYDMQIYLVTFDTCQGGLAYVPGNTAVVNISSTNNTYSLAYMGSVRRIQHEISHCFGTTHNGEHSGDDIYCTVGSKCINNSGLDSFANIPQSDKFDLATIWCDRCVLDFDADRFEDN